MSNPAPQLVQKLWNYCNILRDDGLSCGDYVEQLTFLLFLKMADEQSRPPFNKPSAVPKDYAWPSLLARDGDELETHYRHVLESGLLNRYCFTFWQPVAFCMDCPHCKTATSVKNGTSRHGCQRWRCLECKKTFGAKDHRLVAPETKAAALAQYLEGVGQRAIERLLGVSHNSITNWVKQAVAGKVLKATPAEKVEWVEADELWTYIAKKKTPAGSGGLLIVLPSRSLAGRWGIVEPKRHSAWMRNFLMPRISSSPRTSGTPTERSFSKIGMSRAKLTPSPSKA